MFALSRHPFIRVTQVAARLLHQKPTDVSMPRFSAKGELPVPIHGETHHDALRESTTQHEIALFKPEGPSLFHKTLAPLFNTDSPLYNQECSVTNIKLTTSPFVFALQIQDAIKLEPLDTRSHHILKDENLKSIIYTRAQQLLNTIPTAATSLSAFFSVHAITYAGITPSRGTFGATRDQHQDNGWMSMVKENHRSKLANPGDAAFVPLELIPCDNAPTKFEPFQIIEGGVISNGTHNSTTGQTHGNPVIRVDSFCRARTLTCQAITEEQFDPEDFYIFK